MYKKKFNEKPLLIREFFVLICGQIMAVFLSIFLASCSIKKEQQTKIRIVGLNGETNKVVTRIPEMNVQALASQGKLQQNQDNFKSSDPVQVNLSPQQKQNFAQNGEDFGAFSSKTIQKTFQPNTQSAQQQETLPEKKATEIPAVETAGTVKVEERVVEYDLAESANVGGEKNNISPKSKKILEKPAALKSKQKGIFVQIGSFSVLKNAENSLSSMKKFSKGIVEVSEGESKVYRVLLGPFPNKKKANEILHKIVKSGREAIIVRNR